MRRPAACCGLSPSSASLLRSSVSQPPREATRNRLTTETQRHRVDRRLKTRNPRPAPADHEFIRPPPHRNVTRRTVIDQAMTSADKRAVAGRTNARRIALKRIYEKPARSDGTRAL